MSNPSEQLEAPRPDMAGESRPLTRHEWDKFDGLIDRADAAAAAEDWRTATRLASEAILAFGPRLPEEVAEETAPIVQRYHDMAYPPDAA